MRCLRPGGVGYRVHPEEGLYLECDASVSPNLGPSCGFSFYLDFLPTVTEIIAAEREHHRERP